VTASAFCMARLKWVTTPNGTKRPLTAEERLLRAETKHTDSTLSGVQAPEGNAEEPPEGDEVSGSAKKMGRYVCRCTACVLDVYCLFHMLVPRPP
jgi:hypothetical protein